MWHIVWLHVAENVLHIGATGFGNHESHGTKGTGNERIVLGQLIILDRDNTGGRYLHMRIEDTLQYIEAIQLPPIPGYPGLTISHAIQSPPCTPLSTGNMSLILSCTTITSPCRHPMRTYQCGWLSHVMYIYTGGGSSR